MLSFQIVAICCIVLAGSCSSDSDVPPEDQSPTPAPTLTRPDEGAGIDPTPIPTEPNEDTHPDPLVTPTRASEGVDPDPTPTPTLADVDPVEPPTEGLLPVGVRIADPSFGTVTRRVSDASERGGFETQAYSQLQAFSSDNRFLLLDGSEGIIVRRVDDLSVVQGLDTSGWNAPRWHPTRPHMLVHFDSNADSRVLLQQTNLDDLSTTTIYTFPERSNARPCP